MALQMFLLCVVTITLANCSDVSLIEQRCSTRAYKNICHVFVQPLAIWCDLTSLKTIPDPDEINVNNVPTEKSEYLYVNHSCVEQVDKRRLRKYTMLIALDMTDNLIQTIKVGVFEHAGKMKQLFLTKNKLKKVDKIFQGLRKLTHLHLDENQIEKIDENSFNDVPMLEVLKLNNNNLENIPTKSFQKLRYLKSLDLSENKLVQFLPLQLKKLGNLGHLGLSNNVLKDFDPDAFLAASGIKKLYLNNNSISCFPENAFDNHDLSVLQIAGNPLKTPKKEWFVRMVRENEDAINETVLISNSGSWVCDCKIFAYLTYIKTLNQKWQNILNVECYDPPSLRGRMLSTLSWKDLSSNNNCSDPEEKEICLHKEHVNIEENEFPFFPTTKVSTTTKPLPQHLVTTTKTTLASTAKITSFTDSFNENQESIWVAVIIATASLIVILLLLTGHLIRKMMSQKRLEKMDREKQRDFSQPDHNIVRIDDINQNSRHDDFHEASETKLLPETPIRPSCAGQSSTNLDKAHEGNDTNKTAVKNIVGQSVNGAESTDPLDATRVKEVATSEKNCRNENVENEYESIRTNHIDERNQEVNRKQVQQQAMFQSAPQHHSIPFQFIPAQPVPQQQLVLASCLLSPPPITASFCLSAGTNCISSSTTAIPPSPGPAATSGNSNYKSSLNKI